MQYDWLSVFVVGIKGLFVAKTQYATRTVVSLS